MQILKQPWFLILILVGGIYTYQFYNRVEVTTNTAEAVNQPAPEESSEEPKNRRISVRISQDFPPSRSKNFELSTYLNMKVRFAKSDSDKLIVSFFGEGSEYKNNGERLADWFNVSSANETLKIQSFDKKNFSFNGLSSLKKLVSEGAADTDSDFTMLIEFPTGFDFNNIKIESVTSDIYGEDLSFKKFEVATVSGDLRLKKAKGEDVTFATVSGDSNIEIGGLEEAEFASVSGDMVLSSNTTPSLQFGSVSGDLSLNIPENSQVDVSFESMTGELINDFGNTQNSEKKINFGSLSGSAKIKKVQ